MDFGKESMEHEFERNARTAEAEQSKRAASRVKPTIAKELEEMQKEKERRNILKTNQELILKKIGE
ncbi:relaxase/Mobilization nuclease domain protein [Campylobacter jejuni subsp. jejuni HN-CJD07035]|nr:relaxase/Mobilization nuclease domain protein [Campylobacter jejuni subsp. jejuni HN-CJD07035]